MDLVNNHRRLIYSLNNLMFKFNLPQLKKMDTSQLNKKDLWETKPWEAQFDTQVVNPPTYTFPSMNVWRLAPGDEKIRQNVVFPPKTGDAEYLRFKQNN